MQLKVESEHQEPQARGQDYTTNACTSSIYISTPNAMSNACNDQINVNNSIPQNVVSDVVERQKPVLTIQVNQNQNSNSQQYSNNNENANNLVNIVSCFRAANTNTYPATINHGIENLVQNSSNNNNTSHVGGGSTSSSPFNVSVNKNSNSNYEIANRNNRNGILIKNNDQRGNLLKNNDENSQNNNIVNFVTDSELNISGINHENATNNNDIKINSKSIKCDDTNEISVGDQNVINNSNVDYHNMTLDTITNQSDDKIRLLTMDNENKNGKIIKNTNAVDNKGSPTHNESVFNKITIVNSDDVNVPKATAAAANVVNSRDNNVESVNNQNRSGNENNNVGTTNGKVEATFREQRRRERRERRQARQRAQHGHDHRHHVSVHHSNRSSSVVTNNSRGINGVETAQRVISGYEMLPDIINNHLPPPYTTLPLFPLHSTQPTAPQLIPAPPIVVDDCRFTFPIPIIRRSPSEHSGRKGCCGQFFHSPRSLGIIAMIALGGVACALGGAAWGASGLAGQPSTHLTISLLMIGIGVVLVTISGVAWRITSGSDGSACFGMEGTEFDHCGRQQCIRNNSMSHGLLYPEFQHRQPPPTYQASMQEYRLRLLLLDRDRQSHGRRLAPASPQQVSSTSPPPSYRSNNGPHARLHRHNTVISHPDGPARVFSNNNSNTAANEIVSSSVVNTTGMNVQRNQLSVPSPKDVVVGSIGNETVIKPSAQTSQPQEMTQINHKSQQKILINHNNTKTDVPNLHHSSQVKVNSCESTVNNEFVSASSKLDTVITSPSVCTNNEHDTGMITIVTINNNSNNLDNLSKLINDSNTLV